MVDTVEQIELSRNYFNYYYEGNDFLKYFSFKVLCLINQEFSITLKEIIQVCVLAYTYPFRTHRLKQRNWIFPFPILKPCRMGCDKFYRLFLVR